MLDGSKPLPMTPWYRGTLLFRSWMLKSLLTITIVTGYLGSIEMASDTYVVRGEASWKKNNVEITELPIHVWTDDYEQSVLEDLKLDHGNTNANFNSRLIKNYTAYSTEKKVFFRVRMSSKRKIDLYKEFKLESTINTGRMNLFDHGCLKRYESVGFCVYRTCTTYYMYEHVWTCTSSSVTATSYNSYCMINLNKFLNVYGSLWLDSLLLT